MENIDDPKIEYHETKFIDRNGVQQTIKIPVVQDLARVNFLDRSFIHDPPPPPAQYPFPADRDSFPVIYMTRIREGRVDELEKLGRVCQEWGMFVIEDPDLDIRVLEEMKAVVKGFFELSFEEKKSSVGTYTSTDNMGYGRNFVKSADQTLDWIDRLSMKAAPRGATDGLAVWPNNPPNFRHAMDNYVKAARKVLDELLHALAQALSLDPQAFSQYFDPELSQLNIRVNYYPPCPRPDLTMGLVPHTDISVLTLLIQFESLNGLQVLKNGQWITVT